MKQVVQNYKTGELTVDEVPVPICRSGGVLVRTAFSLVSAGTERMKVTQAKMSMLQMAKARPDKVKQVLRSVKQAGLTETMNKVKERLDTLTPLGYSLAGYVEEVGGGLDEFAIGDAVACAGEGIACHAEYVFVPRNLCARIPDGVDLKDAAFTTVGAIAMNGVRQAGVTVGDSVLVIGLGLVGLLAVQILKAAGCTVIGVDVDASKLSLAKECGADIAITRNDAGLEDIILQATNGFGPDVSYVAASTKSSDPMELSGKVVRDRGKVVVVGMVPVEADWQTYYNKELQVVMSRSYGPGRYDRQYEMRGIDYPVGYVRWTEGRNMDSFLQLIKSGSVKPSLLKPELFKIEDAPTAYEQLRESPGKHAAGLLFEYDAPAVSRRVSVTPSVNGSGVAKTATVRVAMIGAGNFATGTLIPALKACEGVRLQTICSAGGLSAKSAARRHGFADCASDMSEVLADDAVDAVIIATRHDTHSKFTADALRAGKHVFVEKPLALTVEQLDEVIAAKSESSQIVMPGYNRRFSPLSVAVRDFFASRSSPIEIVCRVNAGEIKADSWYQDAEEGGWRIVSEGCHWVDLIQFICGCSPESVFANMVGGSVAGRQNDNCIVNLKMADGSIASLIYVANGDPYFEKERIEVFGQHKTAVIDNWRQALLSAGGKTTKVKPGGSGKGHKAEMAEFIRAIRDGREPSLSFDEAVACTRATFGIATSMVSNRMEYCDGVDRSDDP